ncbi:hypothetical protein IFM89_036996 [Coptis chinensis]|uniref:Uncharacterized protein n=1 Tax=Coptis chinensis TaxID=261450 RepID=A0A835HGR8_9MAGN|nr:hypothetical protein IFM89_036996 [Coptis chinensis]
MAAIATIPNHQRDGFRLQQLKPSKYLINEISCHKLIDPRSEFDELNNSGSLLKNQSTSSTTDKNIAGLSIQEETGAKMRIHIPVEKNKGHEKLVIKNHSSTTTDDHVEQQSLVKHDLKLKPWNLRPRRSSTAAHVANDTNSNSKYDRPNPHSRKTDIEMKEKGKVLISLTKEEIEKDFLRLTGTKPPQKPKKRGSKIQMRLDCLLPGSKFNGMSANTYRNSFS